jgi:hypothetical protein
MSFDQSVQLSGDDSIQQTLECYSVGVTLQANTPKPELIVVTEGGQLSWRLSQMENVLRVTNTQHEAQMA